MCYTIPAHATPRLTRHVSEASWTSEWKIQYECLISNDSDGTVKGIKDWYKKFVCRLLNMCLLSIVNMCLLSIVMSMFIFENIELKRDIWGLTLNIVKHCLHVWLQLLSNRAAIFIAPLIKTSYRERDTETGPCHSLRKVGDAAAAGTLLYF